MVEELHLHGGVHTIYYSLGTLCVQGGVVYVKGHVGELNHYGGIIYDKRPSNRIEYRADKMSDDERARYQVQIARLKETVDKVTNENLQLRKKIKTLESRDDKSIDPEANTDDVLVQRINSLCRKSLSIKSLSINARA